MHPVDPDQLQLDGRRWLDVAAEALAVSVPVAEAEERWGAETVARLVQEGRVMVRGGDVGRVA